MEEKVNEVNDRLGYIYKITNLINGKIYIGKRKTSYFDERYWGSGVKITKAVEDFGKNNFKREILEWCSTVDILKEREKYWIKYYDSRNPDVGYNISKGGEGNKPAIPDELKICKKTIGVQLSNEIYDALVDACAEYSLSISDIMRIALIDYIKEHTHVEIKKGNK